MDWNGILWKWKHEKRRYFCGMGEGWQGYNYGEKRSKFIQKIKKKDDQ